MASANKALKQTIYLASRSPRRRELLKQIGVAFQLFQLREEPGRDPDVDETPAGTETSAAYVDRIARTKAEVAAHYMQRRSLSQRWPVLAADTTVVCAGRIIGKPENGDDAARILNELAGTQHDVVTAVALAFSDRVETALSESRVWFRDLSEDEIRRYVATGESLDKAGGYAIQGRAAAFITRLEGSYSGVMGLPLAETAALLARAGIETMKLNDSGAGDGEVRGERAASPAYTRADAPSRFASPEEILINVTPQESRVAVIEHGVTHELHIERTSARGLVGNIYMGRVVRVLPGMQSAFIDVGGERAAFLHVADIWGSRNNGHGSHGGSGATPIERLLAEGQSLVVQVVKDPIGTKGARLSTQISIAGRFLVYLPQESHIGISQRIEDEEERAHLREKLQQILPPEEKGGFIIRTMAETASDTELQSDVDYLRKLWHGIQERAQTAPSLTVLYQDLNLSLRVLRDFVHEDTARILIDSRETFQAMQKFALEFTPNVGQRIEHYQGERPLFDLYGVEDEIEKALARRVDLKSGGYLIIDQTEALTTVDVNTGGFVGGRSFDDTIFKTNLEAAQVIARQLRMRNLGGIIIIDFIDMDSEEHRHAVLTEFRKALTRDRTRMTVNGFTQLGLVEMTRKRTRESLAHVLCEPCPTCEGRGELKTAQTVCYQILRELLREARQFNAREYRILASQHVIDMFLDEESQSLAMLSDFITKPVSLQVESAYNQEQFDIVLM